MRTLSIAVFVAPCLLFMFVAPSWGSPSTATAVDPIEVDNLRAFAKLYGYVRYFHPSDAAAEVDWEAFVRHGVARVQDAESPEDLRRSLEALFTPIAPTVRVYPAGRAPAPLPLLTPEDTQGLVPVAWQHWGVDVGFPQAAYRSARLHRPDPSPDLFGTVRQRIEDASPYRGMEVRLRAAVKASVTGDGNRGQLWLRVDRETGAAGFFDNMQDRPVTSSAWQTYEITGPVADDAVEIYFGGFLRGNGSVWLDGFEMSVRDAPDGEWRPIRVQNPGFETGDDSEILPGWARAAEEDGYVYHLTSETATEGRRAMRITRDPATPQTLFDRRPEPGEVVDKSLGRGLAARIPLVLYSRDDRTLRPSGAPSPDALTAALAAVAAIPPTAEDSAVRAGGVIIAWNVFQHFYPYFDRIETDWDAVLTESLQSALTDTVDTYPDTLRRLVARLKDGHGGFFYRSLPGGVFPALLKRVEGRLVVVAVGEDETCVRPGDLLVVLNGKPADERLEHARGLVSGSPGWTTHRALTEMTRGPVGSALTLTLERDGERLTCEVERVERPRVAVENRPEPIAEVRPGILYVDLSRAEWPVIEERLEALAEADGVVFDLRGYPRGNHLILRHLTDQPLRSNLFEVGQSIYPDRDRVTWDDAGRWELEPAAPRIGGDVVFLTDETAISYAESFLGIVEAHELAEIVGSPTAGANGNVNSVTLFGTWGLTFTGMRVRKHDGSPHHLVGIRPTIPVERTLDGVRAGRDEVLEAGLAALSPDPESP